MRIGTKSVLFGAHIFWLHPWFVAAAWWKLYGFPWDPRLWAAFFVHDIGYWGKPNMDGPEGEWHPAAGAALMAAFDRNEPYSFTSPWRWVARIVSPICNWIWGYQPYDSTWYCFVFYHSRFLAKRYGVTHSKLCIADKLAICLTPAWLYLPLVRASGEIHEYMRLAMAMNQQDSAKYSTMNLRVNEGQRIWYRDVQDYVRRWVEEHKDGRADTWTPAAKVER